jgi:Uma2 family endonuclease
VESGLAISHYDRDKIELDFMPASLTERLSLPAVQNPPRKRWTRAECERLEALGIFEQQHVELIEGELIDKMGKNRPHVNTAALLTAWLIQVFGGLRVNAEAPMDVAPEDNPTNQPVPDLIVLTRNYSASGFLSTTPQPKDLDLVVEIADTSLAFDLTVKATLYARAAIAEYWVLDVPGRRLIVHREPQSGQYGSVIAYSEQEGIAPLGAPNSTFQVRDVFPE